MGVCERTRTAESALYVGRGDEDRDGQDTIGHVAAPPPLVFGR